MKTYVGERTIDGIKVTVDGKRLDECCDIQQFTELGFEWTYIGNSPRQLALALLADHLGDPTEALRLTEHFMKTVVAELDNEWKLTSSSIDDALSNQPDL